MAIAENIRERLTALFKGRRLEDLTGEQRQEFLRAAADMGEKRLRRYRLYQEYYEGEHRTLLLERARRYLEASGLRYAENFCETIVDVLAERLQVVGFQVEDNDAASDWLTKTVWPKNEMDEKEGVVHTETTKKGDGFLIVGYDEARELPTFTWNRPEIIKPVYSDENPDEMEYAAKVWTTNQVSSTNPTGQTINRLNLYYPDRVEKWFSVGDRNGKEDWAPHVDPEDLDEHGTPRWPIPWTMDGLPDGEPIGIPVIHFRNKPKGQTFGRSEIHATIPQQDALAKQLLDLFYVMDAQGWKQRWASGIPDNESIVTAIGEWIKSANNDAKFGEFAAEDPTPMGEQIEGTLRRMASRSKTPLHLMMTGGDLPSGETLKTAESPLVHKAKDRQVTHGNAWAKAQRVGVRVVEAFGKLPTVVLDDDDGETTSATVAIDPDSEIRTIWGNPESRNEQSETNTLGVQVEILGLSKTTALRKLGYDPEEEEDLREDEREAEPEPPAPPTVPAIPTVAIPKAPSKPGEADD